MTIIVTHAHAGFEALAALAAAAKLYPGSAVLFPERLSRDAALFWERHRERLSLTTLTGTDPPPTAETVVLVNTRRRSLLKPHHLLLEQAAAVHIYDHHPPAADDIEGDEDCIEQVGAAATLLVEKIRRRGIPLNEVEGLLYLLGIYRSTASLGSAAATPRDAAAAAFLWEQGIDSLLLQEYLRAPLTESQKGLLERLFRESRLYEIAGRRILITVIPAGDHLRGASFLVRRLQESEEIDLAVILHELAGAAFLIARTVADELDLE
ncbi:MAG: hypothetical protein GYA86_05605, partial [Firmicutes bacterium]|nr:hypothetical protein [Bacillota bacterium]